MADLTQYMTQKYTKMIAEITADLGKTADELGNLKNLIRALKNPDALVDGASLTVDRLQIMENGDIRVMPPAPTPITDTCVKAPEPGKNGKKTETDLVNAS
jgi:hypothetical protein